MTKTISSLPTILAIDHISDSGEYGNDNCAHCGALGRYQYHFVGTDGARHAAMAGCIRLFPISPIAKAQQKILDKKRSGKKLNGWDEKILAAVEAVAAGTISVDEAEATIRTEEASRSAWVAKKYGGRR